MLLEKIRHYYLEGDYNCAETVVLAANDEYGLGLDMNAVRLVSGYGKGFGACETCGALCGAMAVISAMCVDGRAHATEGFADTCSEYLSMFKARLGTDNCQKLRDKYLCEDVRCLRTVELAAQTLEEYLVKLGKIEKPSPAVTVSKSEIERLKGLGFLHNKGTDNFSARIITGNGRITAAQAATIAQAADIYGDGKMGMTSRLTIEVSGIHYSKVEDFLAYIAQAGLETGGTGPKVRPVVSCKGTLCRFGLIDTFDLSEKVHERFYKGYRGVKFNHKFKIGVGGCPNNCVKPDLNDLGVIGQRVPLVNADVCKGCKVCQVEKGCPLGNAKVDETDGKRLAVINEDGCNHCGRCVAACPFKAVTSQLDGYKIYLGGRWGKITAMGRPMDKIFTSQEEVLDVIENAILLFKAEGLPGERFSGTVERLGFEAVQERILSGEPLKNKAAILGEG